MKRIIPKPSKVKIAFIKDLNIRDILFCCVVFLLIGIVAFSNLPQKLLIALAILLVGSCLFLIKSDERLYYEIFIMLRFAFTTKKFKGSVQNAVSDIKDEYIKFKAGYYAGVIEIDPMEFFLLREETQDRLIDVFSCVFKNLGEGQKLSLFKLDRPIFLDTFVEDLKNKLENEMDEAKKEILKTRLSELEKINTNDNCCYYNAFYVVVYGTKDKVDSTIITTMRELEAGGIKTERLKDKRLIGFVRRTITQLFDEREIVNIDNRKSVLKDIEPKKVKYTSKYTEVDGIREFTYVVNRYPLETFNAWATALCNIDYTKVVISCVPVPTDKALKQLDKSAAELEERVNKTGKISARTEGELHYQSLLYLAEEIGNNNEVMLDVSISVTAYDYENKGAPLRREIKKTLNKLGFRTSSMLHRQPEAYRSSILNDSFTKKQLYTQGINSSSLAAAFPFVSNRIIERNGVMLGENSAPVIIDFFKRSDNYKNSNVVVLGSVGGGKSFFAKTLFANLISDNARLYILDPEGEYLALADNTNGKVIDMGMGGNIINPFAVLSDVSSEDSTANNLLSSHLTFLEEFFTTTLDGLSSEHLELCLSLLPKLYERKGIKNIDLRRYTGEYPTFDDFMDMVKELKKDSKSAERKQDFETLEMFLSKFCEGGRYSYLWNGQTNLEANAEFIVFNFQTLLANANKTIASAQMLLLTQFLNNELIRNYNKIKKGQTVAPIVIAIDEAHVFIDPHNPIALRFMKNTAKRCRKYQGMQVVMTQSVNDFLGDADIERESKAVITESQYTFVFPLNASSASDFLKLYDKLDITQDESNAIMDNPRGSAFFIAHQRNRTNFRVIAPEYIRNLFEKSQVMSENK